jgi:uncharacterized damage-inducible protein DinB
VTTSDGRPYPPETGAERAMLDGFLDFHRRTLRWKCSGLSPQQLHTRPLASTNLSLLGLVRHAAEVERSWFREGVDGQAEDPIYWTRAEPDRDIDPPADADAEADLATWAAEIEAAREVLRRHELDDHFVTGRGTSASVRWLMIHMIEEYARHNGHADLLRQAIDGAVGS